MELINIFDDSLWAIRFDNEFDIEYIDKEDNEFTRLLDAWQDTEHLDDFFIENEDDLKNGYYGEKSISRAIKATIVMARKFENEFLSLAEASAEEQKDGLWTIFAPLDDRLKTKEITQLEESKSKKKWLRFYAIRINKNCYVIVGGAIKLTHQMEDREHTRIELDKIQCVKEWLLKEGISEPACLFELLESK